MQDTYSSQVYARQMPDGQVYYGSYATHEDDLPALHRITISGGRPIPPLPYASTTPREHDAWLARLRAEGFVVEDAAESR